MVNYVLQCLPVYWFSLFHIPLSVISMIRRLIFQFLWAGKLNTTKFHLAAWECLSKFKLLGGWGIKNLVSFNRALCAKSLWRSISCKRLWGMVIKAKYLHRLPSVYWFCYDHQLSKKCSLAWRSLVKSYPIINQAISWLVGIGTQIYLGIDPVVGLEVMHKLSDILIRELQRRDLCVLKHVALTIQHGD